MLTSRQLCSAGLKEYILHSEQVTEVQLRRGNLLLSSVLSMLQRLSFIQVIDEPLIYSQWITVIPIVLCSILSDCWTELYMIPGCTPGKKKMTPPARIFTLCGQLAFILGGHFHDLEDGSKGKVWHYVPQALNGHRLQIVTRDCGKVISATISNFHLKPARNEANC